MTRRWRRQARAWSRLRWRAGVRLLRDRGFFAPVAAAAPRAGFSQGRRVGLLHLHARHWRRHGCVLFRATLRGRNRHPRASQCSRDETCASLQDRVSIVSGHGAVYILLVCKVMLRHCVMSKKPDLARDKLTRRPRESWRGTDRSARLEDPSAAIRPLDLTLAQAQEHVNFLVFEPTALPPGCVVDHTTVRPEQPPGRPEGVSAKDLGQTPWSEGNPSSVRTEVRGLGRSLRIKQFLYDWAPPAASVAALWDCPDLRPYECNKAVAWVGQDYRVARGAVVQFHRTQIEVSVLSGEWSDEELVSVLTGLREAEPEVGEGVRAAAFHELNYWLRYQLRPYKVPYGLYRHEHPRPYGIGKALVVTKLEDLPGSWRLPLPASGWHFESAACFESEAEAVLVRADNPNDRIFVLTTACDHERALALPPTPEGMPAEILCQIRIRDCDGWLAGLTARYGAWECRWEEKGARFGLWTTSSTALHEPAFRALIEELTLGREE